jgi:1-deoxy-D-xylulose-5-phosphate synthase
MDQLSRICGPSDLHSLTIAELQALADEIREVILSCVSEVGGHLAASLGAVELTVALHSVLSSPRDKIVWDVGHQAYAHKIITGRAECFNTIRQYGGLSGFPCRFESEHDVVGTGHASTSISYGLGLVEGARLSGHADGRVVCVLGDGALTGGVAFEAMNQAGQLRTPLVVVLNDNQMSIKPNVGAFQLHLNRFRLDPGLTRLREDMERTIARIPAIGARAYSLGKDVKESMKAFLGPGLIFEELGFAYIGVVNGHDIGALREALRQAMDTGRPVLVHVRTIKGKGYEPAEERPAEYHGTGPFERSNGERKAHASGTTYTEAFGRVLVRAARRDPRVVAITAAMTQGTGLEEFEAEFPGRLYDARRGDLLDVPATRLRHARAGRRPAAHPGGLCPRQGGTRRRRRPDTSRRVRPLVPAADPRPRRHGALEPGAAAAHGAHRPRLRRPGRHTLSAGAGGRVQRTQEAQEDRHRHRRGTPRGP